jgi:hypothetical protein
MKARRQGGPGWVGQKEGTLRMRFIVGDLELNFGDAMMAD